MDESVNAPTGDEGLRAGATDTPLDPLEVLRREKDALQDRLLRSAAE